MTHKKNRLAAVLPAAIAALWACTPVQRAEVTGLKLSAGAARHDGG